MNLVVLLLLWSSLTKPRSRGDEPIKLIIDPSTVIKTPLTRG